MAVSLVIVDDDGYRTVWPWPRGLTGPLVQAFYERCMTRHKRMKQGASW